MVKTSANNKDQINELQSTPSSSTSASASSFCKYKGVRKRKWGKYVSEIRLPNSRERIWLGSHDTAEKAARAFDAALFCLRGPNAKFNFPDNPPPDIDTGRSMTPAEIQVAAARFANYDSSSYSLSDSSSVSGNQIESEVTEVPLDVDIVDKAFLDPFMSGNNVQDFGVFSGFDDFSGDYFVPPVPDQTHADYWQDNYSDDFSSSQTSFLWNF